MKKTKKLFKIFLIILLLGVGTLFAIPLLFEDKIVSMVKDAANDNLNAKIDFQDAHISLFKNFPNATLSIENLSLINFTPFERDTLFYAGQMSLNMSLMELFKSKEEGIAINSFFIDQAKVNIIVNKDGIANYDIGKESATNDSSGEKEPQNITLSLKEYAITNSQISYMDEGSMLYLKIETFNHRGSGDLSASRSELDTQTEATVSFEMDSTNYLQKNKVKLDALLDVDLEKNTYTFLKNEALVNQLPIVFDGFVKVNDNNQEIDLTFKTPSSDFKNFLAVIPEAYSKNIQDVKTEGNFEVNGKLKGIIDDTHIPTFAVSINSENASFQYPNLPKSVKNIHIATEIINTTGITNDTYIDIKKLSFKIDGDTFNAKAKLSNLVKNPYVNAHINGRLNLANLSQAYPMASETTLKGIVDANVATSFDMNSIEKGNYGNTKSEGTLTVSALEYASTELAHPVQINTSTIGFNTKTITLNEFDAKTGKTDLKIAGTIDNLFGFMFNNENIKGDFNLKSNTFSVNDFMVTETTADTNGNEKKEEAQLKIPSFLDVTINAGANTVLYDNLTLKDVKGTLIIKDEKASFINVTSNIFNGSMALNGNVSTKNETPTFDMDLNINAFDITESFNGLELFQALSPVANALQGKLNSTLSLSGDLNTDFTPNLSTVSGNGLAEILSSSLNPEKSKALSLLGSNLNFIDLSKMDLEKLKTSISFENGKVSVKPFKINYQDISIDVSGSHSFNKAMDYNATFNVPAKYLGKEVSGLLANLSNEEANNTTVPVTATITGNFTNPSVKTDLKQATSNLTKQIAAKQKEKLVGKGKDVINKTLGNLLNEKNATKDSVPKTQDDPVKKTANKLINNLFKKKKDTTQ
ncbi:AsmA-like C-terminal region-containing protein [Leptobacterium sp. I13]|uniref:AsmA-like C-terminal region-containing protein n=1 Tax=Leptobacterium meishanense TaxID=3128904 RepID=UPI0030EC7DBE